MLQAELAKRYKQDLGNRAMDLIAHGLGLQKYNPYKHEACCPFHREKTPSFKWDTEKYAWKCFGCGESLDIYRYLQEFKHMDFLEAKKEVANMTGGEIEVSTAQAETRYLKPKIDTNDLSKAAIEYMQLRGISEQTLKDWKVMQRQWNNRDCYVFQYFNQDGDLEFVSYREIAKGGLKGGCEQNTKPILWGMWHIDPKKPVVITEGQPDALAVWESGYKNVVSVPMGSNNLTWIDHCWEWLESIDEFIIFGDNDEPGLKFAEEASTRLGKFKTKIINHKRKDANEILFRDGKEAVYKYIDDAIRQMPKGILDMSRLEYIKAKYRVQEGIETGVYKLDRELEDLHLGELSVLFGRNGDGKSTLINQFIGHCIEKKVPVFLYSGELSPNRILHWMFRQLLGNDHNYMESVQTKYGLKWDINDRALRAVQKWSKDCFYTYDKTIANVRKDQKTLFEVMAIAAKRYGCRLFIIDNLMSAMEENAESLNSDQSNFVQACKDFCEAYNVHVMLVAHPNKFKKQGEKLEKEDISGSNNIPNKADIIMALEKNYDEKKDCNSVLRVLKDREEGKYLEVDFSFDPETKRLYENKPDGGVYTIEYSWKKYLEIKEWWEECMEQEQEELPF